MVNCCVPGCTNYSAITSKTADISYHKFPSDKQRRKIWLERIRWSNMPPVKYSMFAVPIFCQAVSRWISVRRLRDRSVNEDWRRTPYRPSLIMGMRRKNQDYQGKIALNDEYMKKLVFYNILHAFISAAWICLVVQINTHCHLSA